MESERYTKGTKNRDPLTSTYSAQISILRTKSQTCSTVHAFTSSRSAARHFTTTRVSFLLELMFIAGLELFELRLFVVFWMTGGLGDVLECERCGGRRSGESLRRLDTGAPALLKSRAAGWSLAKDAVSFEGLLNAGWMEADAFWGVEMFGGVKSEDGNGVRGN